MICIFRKKTCPLKKGLPLLLKAITGQIFKTALLAVIAVRITQLTTDPANIVAGLWLLPCFMFSARATLLAEKYGRLKLTRKAKIAELLMMTVAGVVFYTESVGLLVALPVVFIAVSAFFGALRYALQPERLDEKTFVGINAYTTKMTYVSIIAAVAIGVLLPVRAAAVLLVALSLVSFFVTHADADAEEQPFVVKGNNPFKSVFTTLRTVRHYPLIHRSILGTTWFWSIGVLMAIMITPLTRQVFNADDLSMFYLLTIYIFGIGAGIMYCTRLLRGVVHTTFVPLSTIGIGVCFFVLGLLSLNCATPAETVSFADFVLRPRVMAFSAVLLFLSFFSGMYITPLNKLILHKSTDANRAVVFAANNLINVMGIAATTLFIVLIRQIGFSVAGVFFVMTLVSLIVSVYNCSVLPAALVRSIMQTILEFAYRVTVKGLPNFQEAGKRVLIIANHTSLLDGLLIAAFMPEKITFVIRPEWEHRWFAKIFGLMVDVVPLDTNNPMSLRTLIDLIKKNNKVMIFPEQRISVTGTLMKVYESAGLVAEKADANILPVRINGAQYSKLSLLKHKYRTQFFPKITINIMPPKKFEIDKTLTGRQRSHEVSNQLYNMMAEMMYASSKINENIFVSLLNAAKIYGSNHIIAEDITRKPMKFSQLILKSYVLSQAFDRLFPDEERIGVLLPNVLANLVTVFAMQKSDKIPAMLNFSSGVGQVLSCIKTVQLKTVLTSRKFIEAGKLEALAEAIKEAGINLVYLEDVGAALPVKDKIKGLLSYAFSIKPKRSGEETSVILFTSGSEGVPKAVFLSHKNMQANRYQVISVLDINASDTFFNALPMFHSFGLCLGTIATTLLGVRTFYYPSPLHYRVIPELVYSTNATIMCGTDTFLAGYGHSAHPYDFFAVKYVLLGAEKQKKTTADLWSKKFGIRIIEGYGTTEAAPLISFNTPMYIREGTVGRLVPGLEMRLEDVPGITEGKRLFLRGDNIMQGYMKADNPGVLQPPPDGWYDTGDIVDIDKDGFITIKGRAKRFAKIGGEMVSLTAVEEQISKVYPTAVSGVVAIADEKKGEQLVLITTQENPDLTAIKMQIRSSGLSDLGAPSKFIVMKEPPLLGTGKFNYIIAQKLAEEKFLDE